MASLGRRRILVRMTAVLLISALASGCQMFTARVYIPAAYALAGLSVALLVSPTVGSALAGLMLGWILGAAVYNNSLKRCLQGEGGKCGPRQ
jgi:hypothetical protein